MNDDAASRDAGGGEHPERLNPFSSRFVRPGAIPFVYPAGLSPEALVDKFHAVGRRGQIVGPHGAGKSTLLASLMREFTARGEHVQHVELHDGQRGITLPEALAPRTVLCIDGYEQLSYVSRASTAWKVRRSGCGLLITTHAPIHFPVRLPTVFEACPSVETAVRLTTDLLAQHSPAGNAGDITPKEVERIFLSEAGDMREVFFRLYDLSESRRS